jgi:Uma2 family endonuclease
VPTAFRFTSKDLDAMPRIEGVRYEIIDGELYVSAAPSIRHQHASVVLTTLLFTHARTHRLGRIFSAPTDVLLANTSIVQPDILYISRARRAIITPANIQGAPDLVIEIISPASTRTDKETKRDLYARYGVAAYWLLDPIEEWMQGYALGDDGRYVLAATARGSETFAAPPFPDLTIQLAALWDDLSED